MISLTDSPVEPFLSSMVCCRLFESFEMEQVILKEMIIQLTVDDKNLSPSKFNLNLKTMLKNKEKLLANYLLVSLWQILKKMIHLFR